MYNFITEEGEESQDATEKVRKDEKNMEVKEKG